MVGVGGALLPEKHICGLGPGWKVELSHQAGTGIRPAGHRVMAVHKEEETVSCSPKEVGPLSPLTFSFPAASLLLLLPMNNPFFTQQPEIYF